MNTSPFALAVIVFALLVWGISDFMTDEPDRVSDDNDGMTHDTAWETIGGPHPNAGDGSAPRYIGTGGNNVNDGLSSYPFKEMTPDERLRSTCYTLVPRHETYSVILTKGVTCISVLGVTGE